MARIDLDDLPPRVAAMLATLVAGEEVLIVRAGAVVARLAAQSVAPSAQSADPPSDAEMAEIMEHFQSIIDDEF